MDSENWLSQPENSPPLVIIIGFRAKKQKERSVVLFAEGNAKRDTPRERVIKGRPKQTTTLFCLERFSGKARQILEAS